MPDTRIILMSLILAVVQLKPVAVFAQNKAATYTQSQNGI